MYGPEHHELLVYWLDDCLRHYPGCLPHHDSPDLPHQFVNLGCLFKLHVDFLLEDGLVVDHLQVVFTGEAVLFFGDFEDGILVLGFDEVAFVLLGSGQLAVGAVGADEGIFIGKVDALGLWGDCLIVGGVGGEEEAQVQEAKEE